MAVFVVPLIRLIHHRASGTRLQQHTRIATFYFRSWLEPCISQKRIKSKRRHTIYEARTRAAVTREDRPAKLVRSPKLRALIVLVTRWRTHRMAVLDWLRTATTGILHNARDVSLSSRSTIPVPLPDSETMASSLPSLRTLSKFALTGAGSLLGQSQRVLGGPSETCSNPQLSCHNTTVVENLCCFNAPGGQLLLTQFWDTAPATGPDDSWTIHGLWYVLASAETLDESMLIGLFTGPTAAMAHMTQTATPPAHTQTSPPSSLASGKQSC